ncbi:MULTISPECIES: hypothetical protein [unclassified Sphingobacterium]|uniref:hypothetical protein n=1 Tax=unclassified Sphingobacterium TaxID=2609468 RepID=UPI0025E1AD75|nr:MULTISPECIES: hypothetical protein [unclassified Sphingobacterium]
MKMKLMYAMVLALVTFAFVGCSKDDDPKPVNFKDHNVTATISLSKEFKKAENDYFNLTITGGKENGTFVDWDINGTKVTDDIIKLGTDDFDGGKTIVLKSLEKFQIGSLNFGGFEFGSTPYTVTWKVEDNGKVVDEGSKVIVKDADPQFLKMISFNEVN